MRIDTESYRKNVCPKCDKFTGDKPVLGKCMANFDDIHRCARKKTVHYAAAGRRLV